MTERLYYTDATLIEFEAKIVACEKIDKIWQTTLDKSAFYPTSGGQNHDTGELNGVMVIDVIEDSANNVLHITESRPGKVNQTIKGIIDSVRRLRHRQSHSAQHILSQAFVKIASCDTMSVHLGEDYSAIEVASSNLSWEQIYESVDLANEVILSNLPVTATFVSAEEASKLPLRKVPSRQENIRVIQIGQFDWSACGGTHCQSTAEIRLIQLLGVEKVRGNTRIIFLAGEMALDDYDLRFHITDKLSSELSCKFSDLPDRVMALTKELKQYRTDISSLQKEMLPHVAEKIAGKVVKDSKIAYVSESIAEYDPKSSGELARAVADKISGLVILHVNDKIIVATSSESGLDAASLVKGMIAGTGLKGGGSKGLAQFGTVSIDQYSEIAKGLVKLAANESSS